ncbi:hypothetical protein FOY66_02570 [Mycoplasma capricolum subsp. capripneumoniae]|uniref:Uncharacterized protein n=1 Tax=Mycoplasma capricolum subsp. capripneumoniae 87001 TaxID=1124992 RepID=A0A9N7BJI0_MYCCC|nr:hypothetical protein [Mycoplasma capricolum]AJK51525.1 hypothetical protein MCCG_0570 [Mycoplasma capricolum subsp. capripneumoniae 87001]AOQ22186.1 hypothetical protein M1601_02585 [Mycoplasma capricolum subsp. capripneumoniae M1601]KEY84558.1 hypothetical protein MCCP_3590 [Mycoplasma capricolum subsp. capripneumoniae 99108]QDL19652.1 hypothetical protein DQW15_02585 [Mycoplasma capricolum subsp. capripneumoniae]QDL20337.1 hypothetical protein DQW16_02585 [Mycoplasma capricolum subsp. cap
MSWTIKKTSDKKLVVKKDENGSFLEHNKAVNLAIRMAKKQKLIVEIFNDKNHLIKTYNFNQTLTQTELVEKIQTELKLAYARKTVAKIKLEKHKKNLKENKKSQEREQLKEVFKLAKLNYKNKKRQIKYIKFRHKIAKRNLKDW